MSGTIDREAQAYNDAYQALERLERFATTFRTGRNGRPVQRVLLSLSARFGCDLVVDIPTPLPTKTAGCPCGDGQ